MSEMKLLAASIFILVICIQSFASWIIIAEYAINKDYITRNLCVNKERPKLHCNGKCQLAKKLASEENQNSSDSSNCAKISVDLIYFQQAFPMNIISPAKDLDESFASYNHSLVSCYLLLYSIRLALKLLVPFISYSFQKLN